MATLLIEVKDSKFVAHNNLKVKEFSETRIVANNWECIIDEGGNITCTTIRFYMGEQRKIKFSIKNGWVESIIKIGDRMPKVLKRNKLNCECTDGTIELMDGYFDKRTAYFSQYSFTKILEEHGISDIKGVSPNRIYQLLQVRDKDDFTFSEEIETDGESRLETSEIKEEKNRKQQKITINQMVAVTNATWVVKTIWKKGVIEKRILYTLDNPRKIEGLPYFK